MKFYWWFVIIGVPLILLAIVGYYHWDRVIVFFGGTPAATTNANGSNTNTNQTESASDSQTTTTDGATTSSGVENTSGE